MGGIVVAVVLVADRVSDIFPMRNVLHVITGRGKYKYVQLCLLLRLNFTDQSSDLLYSRSQIFGSLREGSKIPGQSSVTQRIWNVYLFESINNGQKSLIGLLPLLSNPSLLDEAGHRSLGWAYGGELASRCDIQSKPIGPQPSKLKG